MHSGTYSETFDLAHMETNVAVVTFEGGPITLLATAAATAQRLYLSPGEARDLAILLSEGALHCQHARDLAGFPADDDDDEGKPQ